MLHYLLELRYRLLNIVIIFFMFFLSFLYFAPTLWHQWLLPLLRELPNQSTLIATQLSTPVLTPIKLAMDAALLCSAPFALLQLWYFAAPALYRKERHRLGYAIVGSMILFGTGVAFCFFVVLPLMFKFFVQAVPDGVRLMPDIVYAVDFITHLLILFGLCFQVPLLCLLLIYFKLITLSQLKMLRPYVIVGAFIIGMVLTSADVVSQIMVAIPLCLLYELGIILSHLGCRLR